MKDMKYNIIISVLILFNTIVFAIGIAKKVQGDSDTVVDILKLCLVWGNILLFELLLVQKQIIINGSLLLKSIYSFAVIILNLMCCINVWLIIKVAQASDDDNVQQTQGANKDYLLLGISLTNDIFYLILYLIFHSKRSIAIVVLLVIVEVIMFSVSATSGGYFYYYCLCLCYCYNYLKLIFDLSRW